MAASPRRQVLVDANKQKIVAVVQMITHLKEAGSTRTEIFMVGGHSVVVQGAIDEVEASIWP